MSDSLIERVARALCAAHYAARFAKPRDDAHVQNNVDGNWHLYILSARAAIEAMREPTEAMVKEGILGGYGWEECKCFLTDPTEVWRTMIDAALGKTEGEK